MLQTFKQQIKNKLKQKDSPRSSYRKWKLSRHIKKDKQTKNRTVFSIEKRCFSWCFLCFLNVFLLKSTMFFSFFCVFSMFRFNFYLRYLTLHRAGANQLRRPSGGEKPHSGGGRRGRWRGRPAARFGHWSVRLPSSR